jgi:hypothetical protein
MADMQLSKKERIKERCLQLLWFQEVHKVDASPASLAGLFVVNVLST